MGLDESNQAAETLGPAKPGTVQVAQLVFGKMQTYEIFGRAAQLAYYLLFALFPTLIFLALLISALPFPTLLDQLLDYFQRILPPQAFVIVRAILAPDTISQRPGLLSLSLLATIWAASSGMEAIISSLNTAYQAGSHRSWWKERILAIALTVGLATFILMALVIVFFEGTITNHIAEVYGFGSAFRTFGTLAQWPIAAAFVLMGLDLIYYFAPNISQRWRWVTPGASIAVILWLLISFGFRVYVTRYANFSATYGTLGSFMVLMLWLYLTSATILLGGVINGVYNSLMIHAAIEVSQPDDVLAVKTTS